MRYEQNFAIIARRMVIAIVREIEVAAEFVGSVCLYLRSLSQQVSMSWAPVPVHVCESSHASTHAGLSPWQVLSRGQAAALTVQSAPVIRAAAGNAGSGSARTDIGSADTRMHGLKPMLKRCPAKCITQG